MAAWWPRVLRMAVEAIGGDVQLSVGKPGVPDHAAVGVPIKFPGMCRFVKPIQRICLFEPERFRLAYGFLVQRIKLRGVEQRVLDDGGRRRESTAFVREGFGGNGLAHIRECVEISEKSRHGVNDFNFLNHE